VEHQFLVRAALGDLAVLENEDLIRVTDRGESVSDDKRCAAFHQRVEAVLDHRLGFAIERRCGLVEDENPRIGHDGAGDGNALFLAAGEAHASLAHDRVVLVGESLGKFVDVCDMCGLQHVLARGLRIAEGDVVVDRFSE